MRVLLDTHVLLWAALDPSRLGAALSAELEDGASPPVFSSISIWEVAIKAGLGRADFSTDPRVLRQGLLRSGYEELVVTSAHAAAVIDLPPMHRDPFDRMLVTQSRVEGIELLSRDEKVIGYGPPVRRV